MSTNIKIANAADFVGQEVTLKGWVQKRIDKGKLQFISLRDGTGVMQCVVFKKNLPEEQIEAARYITLESAVAISGALRAEPRAPGGFELDVADFEVIGRADDPYPLAQKRDGGEHGTDFLLNHRHLWLRDPQAREAPTLWGLWGEAADRSRRLLRARDQQLIESEARLQAFLAAIQASPNGVAILDRQGYIEWFNQTAAKDFGLDPQRDLGQQIGNLVRDPVFAGYYACLLYTSPSPRD